VPISTLIAIGVGLVVLGVLVAYLTARTLGRRVATLRRNVRRLAETAFPSWRWTEPVCATGSTS
jgi:hypothetical protein